MKTNTNTMRCSLFAIFLSFTALGSTSSALADGGMRMDRKMERLQEKLDLSEDQTNQVRAIFENAHQESNCHEIDSRKEMKACRMNKRTQVNTQIEALLDENQVAEFKELQAERQERFRNRRGRRHNSGDR